MIVPAQATRVLVATVGITRRNAMTDWRPSPKQTSASASARISG
jgi:hypothetical protein